MCIANLNVSLQPCSHRWYALVRPCQPESNLSNCSDKLKLEGWETRNEHCPWCGNTEPDLDDATHRLFGSRTTRSRSDSSGTSPEKRTRRSSSPTNSTNSLSRLESRSIEVWEDDRAERARTMNWRLDVYLMTHPERFQEARKRSDDESIMSPDSEANSLRRKGSIIGKGFKKGMKLSRGMFKP